MILIVRVKGRVGSATQNIMLKVGSMSIKLLGVLGLALVIGLVGLPFVVDAAAFSTSTLGEAIDEVSGISFDYFFVLIQKFWPFLLGAVILVGVIVFGKRIIHGMWGK